MNSIFLIHGKPLRIRKLTQNDLRFSYYEVMNLLSEVDRNTLRSENILNSLTNDYVYFIVEDININMIVSTGTVIITNTHTQSSHTGYIENIMIHQDYQNIGLGDIIFQYLNYYCLNIKKCIRVITNCEHNF